MRHTSWETAGRRLPITNRSLLGLARRSTLICCLSARISASSATCDRNRSLAIPKINRHKSSIGYQHRAILSQLPARLNLRQRQPATWHRAAGLCGSYNGCIRPRASRARHLAEGKMLTALHTRMIADQRATLCSMVRNQTAPIFI